ncbi:MAG: LysM peptidoglycan-binding domain-containing protein [Geobacteraceae bacterium]
MASQTATAATVAITAIILAGAAGIAYDGADEYRLYTPQPVETTDLPATPEKGILVKIITIKQGDTLSALSRKFFGRGLFYPEFLPFNEINNPDLIYAGKKLRIPLAKASKAATHHKPEEKHEAARNATMRTPRKESKIVRRDTTQPSTQAVGASEATEFERAVKLYQQGAYQKALIAFDGFLERHPSSIFAADATLYRGDCYIHLSGL